MNPTDIIERLVSQLDDEIAAGYEAVSLLERARDQLIEFTNLPDRLVDTLADELGIPGAGAGLSVSHGPATVTVNHDAIEAALAHPSDTARYEIHHPPRKGAKYTLEQVAEIFARHGTAKPGARNQAIADQLEISIKGAEQAVIRARKKGLIPPTGAPAAVAAVEPAEPEPGNYDPDEVDWPAVAACYKRAIVDGRRPITAIAIDFDVPHHVAQDWPKVCRRMGLLPPADQPQVETDPAPHQMIRHTPGRPVAM